MLDRIAFWLDRGDCQIFRLNGYAGTGKTTLIQEAARQAGGSVVFAALTGRAASVMRAKGCDGAATIDSLLYKPLLKDSCARAEGPCSMPPCAPRCQHHRQRLIGKTLNEDSDLAAADLAVIDEVSMIGPEMGADIERLGRPLLVVGDPAQLPPIHGAGYFNGTADFLLTEIHRQAAASPVISMATHFRNGEQCRYAERDGSAIVPRIGEREMLGFDQIIVGRHKTRQDVNRRYRALLGIRDPLPVVGDKLVCLKNQAGLGIYNGTIWRAAEVGRAADGFIPLAVEDEDGRQVEVEAPVEGFLATDGKGGELPGHPFAFGYAITCHKAQGSQWGSVLIFDESRLWRTDRWRWLYTAVTRAVERVTVVRS